MNRAVALLALCAFVAGGAGIACAQQTPEPVPTQSPLEYSDPAMSFMPPPGYYRVPMAPHSPTEFGQPSVVAAWIKNPGKTDQRTITITMDNFSGSLDGAEMISENNARDQTDGIFVNHKQVTKLANGMPAYFQEMTIGSGFNELKRWQYVWIDGIRIVTLTIVGRFGEIDEKQAREDLANASGVLYPQRPY